MATILLITSGLTGMLRASLEVARRLAAEEHRVVYASPHDVRSAVEARGHEYRQLPAVPRNPAPERLRADGESRLGHKWAEWSSRQDRRAAGVEALRTDALHGLLADVKPDLALLDFDLEEHVITCHAAGLPLAILSPWFEFRRRPGLPPLENRMERGTPVARWLAWTKKRARSRIDQSGTYLRYFGTDRRGVIREHARRTGFPKRGLWPHDWSTLFAFEGIPVLSMTMEELDFPHRRTADWTYVGPMVLTEEQDARLDEPLRRLEEAAASARRRGQKLVYASLSSMDSADNAGFAEALTRAAASQSDWTLILGMGGREGAVARLASSFGGELPEGVLALAFAPQLAALKEADLFITHGGIHSIHESLICGVPMLAYSGSAFDQDGCVARLAYHRAASVGERRETHGEIASRVTRALRDTVLREQTAVWKETTHRYGAALERAVDQLIASGRAL